MSQITTTNWNAWINTQPIQPTFGTLHVTGEVVSHPSKAAILVKKVPQGFNSTILLLEIVLHPSGLPTKQPQQVHYVENVDKEDQYNSIDIIFNGNIIEHIVNIPIVS